MPRNPKWQKSSWATQLKRFNQEHENIPPSNTEKNVLKNLRALYDEDKEQKARAVRARAPDSSYELIPRFFAPRKSKKSESTLRKHVRREARARLLNKKEEELLNDGVLAKLWDEFEIHESDPKGMSTWINYHAFTQVGEAMGDKCKRYFRPSIFLKFPQDEFGRVSAKAVYKYITKKEKFDRDCISLLRYDKEGNGRLTEQDLEKYVYEQIPQIPQLAGVERDFYPYYMYTAVRKFIFFHDQKRRGSIPVRTLVGSHVFAEFNKLRQLADNTEELNDGDGRSQPKTPPWFSSRSALEIYAVYLNLDTDHNGMLNKKEFMNYNGGSLTGVFVDRMFQEYRMYKSGDTGEMEMDYKTFLDFVLAMRNKHTREGMEYFWRLLDIHRKGYLTVFTLNYFFRAVKQKMVELGHDPVNVRDIVASEIFDMVAPREPYKITLDDLQRSRCASAIISILTDVKGFWQYDNREILLNDQSE